MQSAKKTLDTEHTETLSAFIDNGRLFGAVLLILILGAGYFYLPLVVSDKVWIEFLRSFSVNLIPVFLIFVLVRWVFRRVDVVEREREQERLAVAVSSRVREEISSLVPPSTHVYPRFHEVPWSDLIDKASHLDIVVQYFDSWAKSHQDALRELFVRGGKVRVILTDPEDVTAVEQIASRFRDYERDGIKGKIEATPIRFNDIHATADSAGNLEVRFSKLPIWYCALKFSDRSAALSPFESKREVGVQSPCVVFSGEAAGYVIKWFDKEFEYLWSEARRWES